MPSAKTIRALNTLLAIHCHSFPQYLRYARPYSTRTNGPKLDTLEQVAEDQRQMGERIAAFVQDAGQTPNTGRFPMEFTDTHDLSIDYVLTEALRYQQEDLRAIGACVDALRHDPAASALAEEALGMAKGHLDSLEELVAPPAAVVATCSC